MHDIITAKFGGTSMADATQFRRVKAILEADPRRRYAVPSAPGRRFDGDEKVTDLLYACHRSAMRGESFDDLFAQIASRFLSIARELDIACDIESELEAVRYNIADLRGPDYAASRGEYLCGRLLAAYLGWEFVDAAEIVRFDRKGSFAAEWTNDSARTRLAPLPRAVIPGFYGSFPAGEIHTFSRGGSDITGAIVARATQSDLYENWTDVPGFLMADPRIVPDPRPIRELTYRELRELSYMGAGVLHEDAIFPVRKAGIPTCIRDTNDPSAPGTRIVDRADSPAASPVTGIAGQKRFSLLSIEKAMMNSELGFGRRVLQALEENGVSFEHLPTGIDSMCVLIRDEDLAGNRERIIERVQELVHPDSIDMTSGLALIATVGRGMKGESGVAARLFGALASAGVNARMIDQGSSELNIIVGVVEEDFEKAIRAIYGAFVTK